MKNELKIIRTGNYWKCANMDTLAPIIEEGIMYLFNDGSKKKFKDYVIDDETMTIPYATKEEQQAYASKVYGYIFKGDKIIINRGRKMVGEIKTVKGYYKYNVNGTYGKCYTEYLLFTDGTKVNIDYCDVIGISHNQFEYRTYCDMFNQSLINVGGRL